MKEKLNHVRDDLHKRFLHGKHAAQSRWIPDQFKAIDQELNEPTPDFGKIADALDRMKRVLDLLGD
jgi:hypothetical protein